MEHREALTLNIFEQSDHDSQWYWHTESPGNHEILGDGGEGYVELRHCVEGFFKQQGVPMHYGSLSNPYGELEKITDKKYRIIKYTDRKEN